LYLRYCDLLVGSKLFHIQNYVIVFAVCPVTAFSLLSNRNLRKSREPVNHRCQYRISISTDISFLIFYLMSGRRCPSLPIWVLRQLVAWHSGRTSIFGFRIFPVLRSTCCGRVTTYVGKLSAIGQPTRPTQPFIPSGLIDE